MALVLMAAVSVSVMSAADATFSYDEYDTFVQAEEALGPAPFPNEAVLTTTITNSTAGGDEIVHTIVEDWPSWNSTFSVVNETVLVANNTHSGNVTDNTWAFDEVPLNVTTPLNGTVGWNSTVGIGNETLVNGTTPSPFPIPIPTPESWTPTPSVPTADAVPPTPLEPCSGVVYDGYLNGCVVYLDTNGNRLRDPGEAFGISQNGIFSIDVPAGNLTAEAVFRMEPATARGQVSPGADICYDISTLMPERLPLAAKAPEWCGPGATPLVLSPLSTLATLIGDAQVEDVFELPAGVVGSDVLRGALDGDQVALGVMRREIQVKNVVSMLSSAVTGNQNAYSRIARATFKQLGEFLGSGESPDSSTSDDSTDTVGGITSRRMLLQSPTGTTPTSSLSTLFQGLYATLAADSEIDVSDIAFLSNDQLSAVATSIATFNDLSDSLAGSVQDIYRLVLFLEAQLLPAVQSLVDGTTTTQDFYQSNTLDKMVMSFQQTSLPDGSISDPLAVVDPAPAPTTDIMGSSTSSSSLQLGLGLGIGLGVPLAVGCIAGIVYWKRRASFAKRRAATHTFVPTAGRSPKTIRSPVVTQIAVSPGVQSITGSRGATPRSPLGGNVV